MKYLILFILITAYSYGQHVTITENNEIVASKIAYDNCTEYKLQETVPVISDNGKVLAFINKLNPQGYIVVAADKNLSPVMAYSYLNNVDQGGKLYNFVKNDLQYRMNALDNLPQKVIEKRSGEWIKLLNNTLQKGSRAQYWPDSGSTGTGGWIVEQWHQDAPYNNMCPMDQVNSARSIAGCPSVAMGMIVDFHKTTNGVLFDDNDDYYHNYAGRQYWVDDDFATVQFPSFPDLNLYLDTVMMHYQAGTPLTNNDRAAVVFACGVAATQVYTSGGSGTFSVNQAYQAYQKFNFNTVELLDDNDTNLYTRIQDNIKDTLPVHLAVVDPSWSSGHNVVIDGYNTNNYYHINFGWGGSADGWYLLPDDMPYGLTVVEGVVVDIIPGTNVNIVNTEIKNVSIYPNPAKDKIYLENLSGNKYSIYNISGSLVRTGSVMHDEINLFELEPGMFILKISNNSITIQQKIVKL